MDNLDKKKIHINPDFFTKRGETQSQSRVHVNPAFFAKSRVPHGMQQPTNIYTTSTVLNPSLQNVNARTHVSSTPVNQDLQAQTGKDFASCHSLTMNKQYFSSQISNKSLFKSVCNSKSMQTVHFCTSKSQPVPSRTISAASGSCARDWNYQSNLNSGKPSSYSWKASEPSQPKKLWFSTVSDASRSLKLVDSSMSFRSSRFKYQCQDNYFINKSLVTGNHISKHSGSKFKIDNRKNGLVVNENLRPTNQMVSDASKKNENLHEKNAGKVLDVNAREQSDPALSVSKKPIVGACTGSGNEDCINDLQSVVFSLESGTSASLKYKSMMKKSEDHLKKVKVESQDLTPNYKVISRTKLVRRRSKSISKDKTKVNVSKGKLLEKRLPGHPFSVTVCRPSPKFPTRSCYQWGKNHPKRRYDVLSRTKLIRRLSCSSTGDDTKDIPRYTVKTRTKLVKKQTDCNQNGADANKNYVVLSSTKLIRKDPAFPVSVTKGQISGNRQHNDIVIRRHKLVRNANVKTGSKYGCERLEPKSLKRVSSLYKIVNKSLGLSVKQKAARGIVSKYKINRLKSEVPPVRKLDAARDVVSKYRINRLRAGSSIFKKQRLIGSASQYRLNRLAVEMSFTKREKASKGVISKYRINRLKCVQGIVSKYRINRLKPVSPAVLKSTSGRFKWITSKNILQYPYPAQKSGSERFSGRIISIGGILYKATRTSLKKQLAKKKHLSKESNVHQMGSKCVVKLHGYQYYLSASGKTMTRVKGELSSECAPSLSRVHIGGLTYSRTKAGQYELTKAHQARAVVSSAKHRSMVLLAQRRKRGTLQKRNQYCIFFNRFGRCTKKDKGECPYLHDPKRVAICTRFLRGRCPVDNCPFSHEIDPNKMPVCSHFVRSTCTREKCPYRHVKVSASAPLCLDFLQGYCPLAEECKKQHILECEEFNKTGKCPRGESCPLSHRKGKRQKKKSVSLEPASVADSKLISRRQARQRKTSEPQDVLGESSVKKVEKPPKLKKSGVGIKRYFHVHEMDDNGKECIVDEENVDKKIPVSSAKQSVSDGKCMVSSEKTTHSGLGKLDKPTTEGPLEQLAENNNCGNSLDLTQVRERALQKVEKLKKAYLYQEGHAYSFIRNTDKNENAPMSAENSKIVNGSKTNRNHETEVEGSVNNRKEAKSENTVYTNERRPLPKRLPSYIPLSSDNSEIEDL